MRAWLADVLDELLLVEARLPRTLRTLFWPPGEVTARWWKGQRASYVHPLRIYLLIAIPFFFAVSTQTSDDPLDGGLLEIIVEGTYMLSGRDSLARRVTMEPLPTELANDSVARVRWRAEFERRRAENRTLRAATDRNVLAGIRRIFDLLPVAVGIVMVPCLAAFLWGLARPRRRFVGYLVFSLHLHAVAYCIIGVGWLFGAGLIVGTVLGSVYLGVALHRIEARSVLDAVGHAFVIPIIYGAAFIFGYVLLVEGLGLIASDWVFAG